MSPSQSTSSSDKFIPLDDSTPGNENPKRSTSSKFIPLEPQGTIKVSPEAAKNFPLPITARDTIDNAADLIPLGAGALGTAAGGPLGGAALAGIGGIATDAFHRAYNNAPSATPGETLNNFSSNAAIQLGGEALPIIGHDIIKAVSTPLSTAKQALMLKLAQTMFAGGGKADPEATMAAIKAGLDPTIGQMTKNPIANLLENSLAGKEKITKEIEQTGKLQLNQEGISKKLAEEPLIGPRQNPSTQARGAAAQAGTKGNLEFARDMEKVAYNNFENKHINQNIQTINTVAGYEPSSVVDANGNPAPSRPIIESKTIKGPIYTPNATAAAQRMKPQLDAFLKGDEMQTLPPEMQGKFRQLYNQVNNLANGTEILGADGKTQIVPLKDYDTVKQMITSLNEDAGRFNSPNLQQGGLQSIAAALDKDRDLSISNWNNGTQATKDLETAKAVSRYRINTFNEEVRDKIFSGDDRRIPADPSEFFNTAYQSPEKAKRLMSAMGSNNAKYIKSDYFDNQLAPKLFDPATKDFTPNNLIRELSDPNSVSRSILSADERSGIMEFAKAAQSVAPSGSNLGKYALAMQKGRIILHLSSAAAGAMLGHSSGSTLAGATGAVALDLGASDFAKILVNPNQAKSAARLVKIPVNAAEADARSKLILAALKGSQIMVNTNDGNSVPAQVQPSGKIKLLEQPQ